MHKLYPQPYLPQGSQGPAVKFLQQLLIAGGYNDAIIADGFYGAETAKGVQAFQRKALIDDDGNFGPDTRAKWLECHGLDVNKIPRSKGSRDTQLPPGR